MEPGAKKLELENVRKPVEVRGPYENWRFAFEVTGAQTSPQSRAGIAEPGKTYVKVFVRARNVATDRPAPFNDDATALVELAKRPGPQESCSPSDLVGNGQFCEDLDVASGEREIETESYYFVGGTWEERYYAEGMVPAGGYGQILVEGGPYTEPVRPEDLYVFVQDREHQREAPSPAVEPPTSRRPWISLGRASRESSPTTGLWAMATCVACLVPGQPDGAGTEPPAGGPGEKLSGPQRRAGAVYKRRPGPDVISGERVAA